MKHAHSNRVITGNDLPLQVWPWEPNWISFRSSLANIDRRIDRGDVAVVCGGCGCEVDITPAPHSPRCTV